ncbi:MAG: hypothetical protein OXG17_07875 [Chloroflexi bacterium]|nr:hypothetical protein [Chloroflexota bacterium]
MSAETTAEALTRAELREELDRSLTHYATKADLKDLELQLTTAISAVQIRLMMWTLFLVSVATGVLIAVDKLTGPVTGG